jgi:hypothetical protein
MESTGGRCLEQEIYDVPARSVKTKNTWIYTSLPPYFSCCA